MSGGGAHAVGDRGGRGVHGTYAPGAQKLRAELMERLARAMLVGSDTSPYPSALA